MTEKQFWSRKDICKLFHKAYTHKDVYKHSAQTEGIEILEELFGLDIYSKDYKIWNSDDELIGLDGNESKKFNLAYEAGEWWAVRDGDILFWKEEVVALLNELYDKNIELKKQNRKLQSKYDKHKTDELDVFVETENLVILKKDEFEEYVRRYNELKRQNKRRKKRIENIVMN